MRVPVVWAMLATFPRRHYPDRVQRVFLSPTYVEHPWFTTQIESWGHFFGNYISM
jgi:hypothetical protein